MVCNLFVSEIHIISRRFLKQNLKLKGKNKFCQDIMTMLYRYLLYRYLITLIRALEIGKLFSHYNSTTALLYSDLQQYNTRRTYIIQI